MQAGSDVPPSHAGLARTAEGDHAPPARRPEGGVAPSVLQVAAVAASRLATEGPPQPFELTAPDDYELDAPDAALPPGVPAPRAVAAVPAAAAPPVVATPSVAAAAPVVATPAVATAPPVTATPADTADPPDAVVPAVEAAPPAVATPPAVPASPEPNSDEALMRAFAAGDAEAFTRLYDRHERSTWRFIRHRLGRAHEAAADDVMQEAWISVARAAPRYEPTARFTTWLFTIARSRAVDYLRAQAPATLSLDAPLDGAADDAPATWADVLRADAASEPSLRVESRQQAEAFLDALAQLPALQSEAFVLQAEAGLSVEEIAQATGVGAETAKTRLRYARTRLRGLLAEWKPT
jgi:RNA polymerase sigma-70 factor (ECF subfamily)